MTWAHHQGSLCQYFYTHIAQISKVACAVIFLCIHRTYTHVHTCTHSYICFVHQGASSFYDKRKVGVQIFTCYFHLLLETGNRKQETTPLHGVERSCSLHDEMDHDFDWVFSVQSLKEAWIISRSWSDRKKGRVLNSDLIWNPLICPRCPHWQWRPCTKVRLGS